MKKLPYREGDLFALPLEDRGYAIGLVARSGPRGRVLFGYFFGFRRDEVPDLAGLPAFLPEHAVLYCRFGDLHLMDRRWPVLGQLPGWDRATWKMPPFVRHDPSGRKFQVVYSDADPAALISDTRLPNDAGIEPRDIMSGAGAVEIRLTKLLSEI